MFTRLLEQAKSLYPLSPCRCKTCGTPLPFHHHADHLCEECLVAEIDRDFIQFEKAFGGEHHAR